MEHNQTLDWVDEPRKSTNDASFFFERVPGGKFVIYQIRCYCWIHTQFYHFSLGFIYLCDGVHGTPCFWNQWS